MLYRILKELAKRALGVWGFHTKFLPSLPREWVSSAMFIFYRDYSAEEYSLSIGIDHLRSNVCDDKLFSAIISPGPGSFEVISRNKIKVGESRQAEWRKIKKTGSSRKRGILFKRLTLECNSILELGTNIGLSGCYFLSNPSTKLVTVEGSFDLSEVARKNLSKFKGEGSDYTLMNMLFDDAINELTSSGARFDAVFIDGHHEKDAPIYYLDRVLPLLNPGATIIVDDIYWSEDMSEAWQIILNRSEFSHVVDFITVGVCKLNDGRPSSSDIGNYVFRPEFYNKPGDSNHWWDE